MKPLTHTSLDTVLGRICIDLDDFDRIVDLLRRHCRSVQIIAHNVVIKDSSQFQGLLKDGDRPVQDLEIERTTPSSAFGSAVDSILGGRVIGRGGPRGAKSSATLTTLATRTHCGCRSR